MGIVNTITSPYVPEKWKSLEDVISNVGIINLISSPLGGTPPIISSGRSLGPAERRSYRAYDNLDAYHDNHGVEVPASNWRNLL